MTQTDPTPVIPTSVGTPITTTLSYALMGQATNRESRTLATDMTTGSTSIVLSESIDALPEYAIITIDNERILAGPKDNGTKTYPVITRGFDGSTAAAHSGSIVHFNSTAYPINRLIKEVGATQERQKNFEAVAATDSELAAEASARAAADTAETNARTAADLTFLKTDGSRNSTGVQTFTAGLRTDAAINFGASPGQPTISGSDGVVAIVSNQSADPPVILSLAKGPYSLTQTPQTGAYLAMTVSSEDASNPGKSTLSMWGGDGVNAYTGLTVIGDSSAPALFSLYGGAADPTDPPHTDVVSANGLSLYAKTAGLYSIDSVGTIKGPYITAADVPAAGSIFSTAGVYRASTVTATQTASPPGFTTSAIDISGIPLEFSFCVPAGCSSMSISYTINKTGGGLSSGTLDGQTLIDGASPFGVTFASTDASGTTQTDVRGVAAGQRITVFWIHNQGSNASLAVSWVAVFT